MKITNEEYELLRDLLDDEWTSYTDAGYTDSQIKEARERIAKLKRKLRALRDKDLDISLEVLK